MERATDWGPYARSTRACTSGANVEVGAERWETGGAVVTVGGFCYAAQCGRVPIAWGVESS